MRTLLLMRGAPGSGKSTWIKTHNLEEYTLCPDDLRVLCASKELTANGNFVITQDRENENKVWKILFEILEHRMSRGEFTAIDATCSKTKDMQQYRDLAEKYRYRTYIVDFTKVPLNVCLEQNKLRPEYKWVPEEAIRNIYARFATQAIPARIKVIQPDEIETLFEEPFDASEYKRLVFIGDIHGCYDTLMQYLDFKTQLRDDTEYIFLGDYIDRGNQNAEVMKFMNSIMDKPNVCVLEGNHERNLSLYGDSQEVTSPTFKYKTRAQLIKGKYTEKEARMFYRKVRQFSHIIFNGIEILACHAGIPNLNTNLLFIPTEKFIHGAGTYSDYTTNAQSWMAQTKENCYLIHGHRNPGISESQIADRVFNLEGHVEFGGEIRIVECEFINQQINWNIVTLPDCQPIDENLETENRNVETISEAIAYLRNNKLITEKSLGNGISSFNFSREAFLKRNWNQQTILARGLFIDTINNKIMARSYEKFFKIDEVPSTSLMALYEKLKFPVQAYIKENGFLAIISYDYIKDDLFIASKSTSHGNYVEFIETQIAPYRKAILKYLKNSLPGYSLVFECEDIEHDPHIIKYEKSNIILLDAIANELEYKSLDYNTLIKIATTIGCPVKQHAFEINTWEEFKNFYNQIQEADYKYEDKYIEGFVFVDANGFMTKCKTSYYNKWKKLRGIADQTLHSGYTIKTSALVTAEENYFYGFCRQLYNEYYDKETKTYPFKTDIISLREKFKEEHYEEV